MKNFTLLEVDRETYKQLQKNVEWYKSNYLPVQNIHNYHYSLKDKDLKRDLPKEFYRQYMYLDYKFRPSFDEWFKRISTGFLRNIKILSKEEILDQRFDSQWFRSTQKYVKNKNHKKKNRIEDSWRVEKKFNKRRGKYRCGFCVQPTSKKSYQKESNRKHRSFIKQKMYNEMWDDIPTGKVHSKHYFKDPWMWS